MRAEIELALERIKKHKPKITVIGDLILDEYIIGYPERISREAPVLILEYKENYYRLGGAANAAINAAKLGAEVNLIGITGNDQAYERMSQICEENNINLCSLKLSNKPTTLKTRILATNTASSLLKSGNFSTQQVLRLDHQNTRALTKDENKELLNLIEANLKEKDNLVLLSDYALGVLNKDLLADLINSQNSQRLIVADPSGDFARFKGVYLITPNQPDTEKELKLTENLQCETDKEIEFLKNNLADLLGDKTNFLITRGSEGMLLINNQPESKPYLLPAFNKAEVFDVTGAGDTVSACISVALACGIDLQTSVLLGNLAASIVVRKAGAANTNLIEMKEALNNLSNL